MKMIICLDGCGPDYLAAAETPNLDALARAGSYTVGRAVVPTVTNVNNTSIVTASLPEAHGVTTNFLFDPATGRQEYVEEAGFLRAETVFARLSRQGGRTCLLTAKDKLRTLIGEGAAISESAERPSPRLLRRLGEAPGIYTIEVNHWLLQAALWLVKEERPDFLYCSTTDYVAHTYEPDSEPARRNIRRLDALIGEIVAAAGDLELVVTADHGMNAKRRGLDLEAILAGRGIESLVVPIIKDRHVVHHQNLGGSAYVYLFDPSCCERAGAIIAGEEGVEAVLSRQEAAERYRLAPDRIGSLFVLADRDTVFGSLGQARCSVTVRSHGSLYEEQIPIYAYGPGPVSRRPGTNAEVASWLFA